MEDHEKLNQIKWPEYTKKSKRKNNKKLNPKQAWVCPGPENCRVAYCVGCGNWCSDFPPEG